MAREVREIPQVVSGLLTRAEPDSRRIAGAILDKRPLWASVVGRGTSDHAATYARYLLEVTLGVPVGLGAPSLTTVYGAEVDWLHGLVVGVSQSGRSPDVVAVLDRARAGGALTLAITNDPHSTLAGASEHVLECHAGPERSVAATKTFVAELVAVAQLAAWLDPTRRLVETLRTLSDALSGTIEIAALWVGESGLVEALAEADRAIVFSRGYNLATALEVALKLQETAGLSAHGYSAADLEHGPIVLAGKGAPTLAIRPPGEAGRRVDTVVDRVESFGGEPWIIGMEYPDPPPSPGNRRLLLPYPLPDALTPMALVIPGQLLAESVAVHLGLDPDAPQGLSKVTLTH